MSSKHFLHALKSFTTLILKVFLSANRSSQQPAELFYKISVLENFTEFTVKHCTRVSFLIKLQALVCNFVKKETVAQVLSCEFCQISKNTFS